MNATELSRAMFAAKKEIDDAMAEFERAIRADAEADRKARIAKSTAYLSTSGTVGERDAHMQQATADIQYEARLAEGLKKSASSAVESKRQWLSSLQSLASLTRAEAQLAKWTPSEVESA